MQMLQTTYLTWNLKFVLRIRHLCPTPLGSLTATSVTRSHSSPSGTLCIANCPAIEELLSLQTLVSFTNRAPLLQPSQGKARHDWPKLRAISISHLYHSQPQYNLRILQALGHLDRTRLRFPIQHRYCLKHSATILRLQSPILIDHWLLPYHSSILYSTIINVITSNHYFQLASFGSIYLAANVAFPPPLHPCSPG